MNIDMSLRGVPILQLRGLCRKICSYLEPLRRFIPVVGSSVSVLVIEARFHPRHALCLKPYRGLNVPLKKQMGRRAERRTQQAAGLPQLSAVPVQENLGRVGGRREAPPAEADFGGYEAGQAWLAHYQRKHRQGCRCAAAAATAKV